MNRIITGDNAFFDAAEKHCRDNDAHPQLCISANNKGQIFMVGNPNLDNKTRLQLIKSAYETMAKICMDEMIGMKNAKKIDLSKGDLYNLDTGKKV